MEFRSTFTNHSTHQGLRNLTSQHCCQPGFAVLLSSTLTVGTSLASAASNFTPTIAVTPIVITGGNELPGADRDKDGIKQVVVTIPRALALGSKLFARLNVVVP